ncbi:D-alanine--poly(phosphoribitol) ligase subunit DltA [Streptococcus sp. S784/96/1]|uniref:D-alanine--poly(phosphoribitol) ligase subunit DltA n=1 Tax=Streptococcus sp. S784/96/1 TaxID=2653499 RepID=UPI001389445D|nr:D-alanine--poly(phosphoribitol) ligase subunit DltA [Streptococcus sp. S784/96/1]
MIKDMISQLNYWAEVQGDYPVYDILGEKHSYKKLKEDSDALAAYIDSLNLLEHSPIMVFGGHEYEMLVCFVAATKSGHAYIPVDQHSALERIEAILEIAKPSIVLSVGDFPLAELSVPLINLNKINEICTEKLDYKLSHSVKGNETYYIIFTSGTTGAPKGVQISHNNLLSFTNWMITSEDFKVPERPQMLAQPPYSFDLSVMYWAPTLAKGGTLFALPKTLVTDFKRLFSTIYELPIGVWTSTPSFVDMAMASHDFNAETLPDLSHFYFCGEELTLKTAQKLRQRFPKARIINSYGPTEATVAFSALTITNDLLELGERLPIGYVKSDSPTFIIDDEGKVLPAGEQGEIVVTGPAISKGYLNNPEKTAEAFFELNGQPAYHTGDLGIMTQDGLLYYGGRLDFQIKFNGYRIELEDVAQNLNKSQLIETAVAVPRYNKEHKVQNLIAYVVLKAGIAQQFDRELTITKTIRDELKEVMMDYMMPTKFIYCDNLPLTPNGKVDLKGLIIEVNKA